MVYDTDVYHVEVKQNAIQGNGRLFMLVLRWE